MKKGDRDVVWEELERLYGPVTNAQTRGRRNRVVRMIKDSILALAEISPERFPRNDDQVRDEIRARYSRFVTLWSGIKPTDSGLMSRWDDCDPVQTGAVHVSPKGPVRIDEPPAPPEVVSGYLEQMREKGWIKRETPD